MLPTTTNWFERALWISRERATALVVVGLALSWVATYVLGGAGHVAPHWFYAPILVAATRFGVAPTIATAVAAGMLAGPLMPLDVAQETVQPLSDWTSRSAFFIANGLVMSFVIGRLRAALVRELDVVKSEQQLARHKEEVIQVVSHEFRTPLTVISACAEVLAQPGVVAPEEQPLVEALGRAARRLDALVRVVLAAAGTLVDPERTREEVVALRDLCQSVAAATEPSEGSRIRFRDWRDAETVVCDPDLLALLLQAVIDNALKFSPSPTPVEITARRLTGVVEVCVRDQGPGMSEDDLGRAFEPFTQKDQSATRSQPGLGLGLFAARRTAEVLGAKIELQSPADGGVEAIITIPQATRGQEAPVDSAEAN